MNLSLCRTVRVLNCGPRSEAVQRACRSCYVDGNVRFGIGTIGFVLRFCGGRLVDIVPEASTVKWD